MNPLLFSLSFLGKRKPTRYLNDFMAKLLLKKFVVYTIPDKPNSRLQKYRLTALGKKAFKTSELNS